MSERSRRRIDSLSLVEFADLAPVLLDMCPDGIILVEQESLQVTFANEQALLLFEDFHQDLVGSPLPFEILEHQPQEIRIENNGGNPVFVAVKKRVVIWNEKSYWLLAIRDVTARILLRERLATESLVDELTGLLNRRGFISLGEHALQLAERERRGLVLVFIDLDDMKLINDRHGHKGGDDALKAVAKVLRKTFRRSDILARIGGDEFVVVAHGKTPEDKPQIKRRLFENLKLALEKNKTPYSLSISVGFADYSQNCGLDDLLELADSEMYAVKYSKKSREE